jgi:Flp pilus assembly protein TadD
MNRQQRRAALKDGRIEKPAAPDLFPSAVHHYQAGQLKETEHILRRVLALEPDHAEAAFLRGLVAHDTERPEDAITYFRKTIAVQPEHPDAYNGLGMAYRTLDRVEDAVGCFQRALEINPDFAEAHTNCGNALRDLGRLDEAFAHCSRAVALTPGAAEIRNNLGSVLRSLGRVDEAIAEFRQAAGLRPDLTQVHFNLAMALLSRGDLTAGWAKYEWRLQGGVKGIRPRDFSKPQWQGEDLNGRTILLYAEQGLGDTIQFCRYAPLVAARGGRVILEVPRPLVGLLSGLEGVEHVIVAGEPLPVFDFHCSLMSLPNVFGTTLATIPATTPYLPIDEPRRKYWQQRLTSSTGLRIGIVWAGNPNNPDDRQRSLPFAALAPLWNIPGIRWYSLQVGERRADLDAAPPGMIEDLSPALNDFAGTAAVISQLDLVLSVCTSVAHLSGTIGCPTWVMLHFAADWRWMTERQDTPWYPSARLFRQAEPGEWGHVIHNITFQLRDLVHGSSHA